MGMFDDVILAEPTPCPKCRHPLIHFQSKDRDCVMETLTPADVNNFYTHCPKCGAWVDFIRTAPAPDMPKCESCGQHLPRPRDTAWPEQFSLIPDDYLPDYIAAKNRKISERLAAPSEETTNG